MRVKSRAGQSISAAAWKQAAAGHLDFQLEIFRYAGNLPAIVFAVEFVGEKVELGLQCAQVFDWSRLPRLQLNFLHFSIQADRFNRPSALLQVLRGAVGASLVNEKEIVVELHGIAERFVQLLVFFRML